MIVYGSCLHDYLINAVNRDCHVMRLSNITVIIIITIIMIITVMPHLSDSCSGLMAFWLGCMQTSRQQIEPAATCTRHGQSSCSSM